MSSSALRTRRPVRVEPLANQRLVADLATDMVDFYARLAPRLEKMRALFADLVAENAERLAEALQAQGLLYGVIGPYTPSTYNYRVTVLQLPVTHDRISTTWTPKGASSPRSRAADAADFGFSVSICASAR